MDKRFVFALVLSVAFIFLVETIFPPPKRTPATAGALAADSARDTTQRTAVDSAHVAGAVPAPAPTSTTPTVGALAPAPASTAAAVAAPVETTTVVTPLSVYRFSSQGASLVDVQLNPFKPQNGEQGPLHLARANESLLRFRIVSGRDTLRLDTTPFALTKKKDAKGNDELEYRGVVGAVTATIRYTVVPDSYTVRLSGELTGAASPSFLVIEMPSGLRSQERDSVDDQRHFAVAYKPTRDNAKSILYSKLDPGERQLASGPLAWAVTKNKYFLVGVLMPDKGTPLAELSVIGGPRTGKLPTTVTAQLVAPVNGTFAYDVYVGPQEWRRLLAMGRDFENSNPYGGFLQGVVQPFATIVMRILLWMHERLALGYGLVLVIFGVSVRLLLWPLNQRAMRTSLKLQRVQPELQVIQKKYGQSDPAKFQQEMMRIYKEHGMSPMSPFLGCLPMLLPMPILISLFFVFQNTIEFRGVSFLWLHDISVRDPYYILPIIMAAAMFLLSWIGMRAAPPNPQAKVMMYMMPAMFLVFLANAAAGLNLYYAVQNLASIPQQWIIAKERAKGTPPPGAKG